MGVLSIQLIIAKGEWHPEADDGIALAVYAFAESGLPATPYPSSVVGVNYTRQ